jgi:general secretion pathway protein I
MRDDSGRNDSIAGRYLEAVSRARSHLAAAARDPAVLKGRHDGDDGGGYAWHIEVVPLAHGFAATGQKGARGMGFTLYSVLVAVSWQEGLLPRKVVLETRGIGADPPVAAP